jgi:hypothetical protein
MRGAADEWIGSLKTRRNASYCEDDFASVVALPGDTTPLLPCATTAEAPALPCPACVDRALLPAGGNAIPLAVAPG